MRVGILRAGSSCMRMCIAKDWSAMASLNVVHDALVRVFSRRSTIYTETFSNFKCPHALLHCRQFTVSGAYGYSIFGGTRQRETNVRLVEPPSAPKEKKFQFKSTQWPGITHRLGSKYFWRHSASAPITFGRMLTEGGAENAPSDICLMGSADSTNLEAKTIENCLFSHTRGFASQLVLHGRGVKAYFEPHWPHLHIRLGVGSKPIDATRVLLQHAGCVKLFLDKNGTLIVVHGYDKAKVGSVTMRLLNIIKANPYTMKGGHLAFHPIKQKFAKKK